MVNNKIQMISSFFTIKLSKFSGESLCKIKRKSKEPHQAKKCTVFLVISKKNLTTTKQLWFPFPTQISTNPLLNYHKRSIDQTNPMRPQLNPPVSDALPLKTSKQSLNKNKIIINSHPHKHKHIYTHRHPRNERERERPGSLRSLCVSCSVVDNKRKKNPTKIKTRINVNTYT